MIRVLVVEDSPTVRELLIGILSSDPDIEVIGTAETGEEALEAVERFRPDLVTMDVHMPKMNGFDATRRIMETRPTPIVIVSGTGDATDTTKAFRAIESGALAILQKPSGLGHPGHEQISGDLLRTVKLMSEVKVVEDGHAIGQRRLHLQLQSPTSSRFSRPIRRSVWSPLELPRAALLFYKRFWRACPRSSRFRC